MVRGAFPGLQPFILGTDRILESGNHLGRAVALEGDVARTLRFESFVFMRVGVMDAGRAQRRPFTVTAVDIFRRRVVGEEADGLQDSWRSTACAGVTIYTYAG